MCRVPVTFGGGSMIVYGSPRPLGANAPEASQRGYHLASMAFGSNVFSMGQACAPVVRASCSCGDAIRLAHVGLIDRFSSGVRAVSQRYLAGSPRPISRSECFTGCFMQ